MSDLTKRMRDALRAAQREARTDPLTGLGNRRAWDEAVERRTRCGDRFCVLLFDVANLKAANARLGHWSADELLKRVAIVLRAGDVNVRLGGDEFGVVVSASRSDAENMRDRIEAAVGRFPLAEGVSLFIVGEVLEWTPGADLLELLTDTDKRVEARKLTRKAFMGECLTREAALAAVNQ